MSLPDITSIARVLAPPTSGTAPRKDQRLANTGTTESSPSTALTVGAMATLVVGAAAVRIEFAASTGLSTQVAITSKIIPAYGRIDWAVESSTRVPYIEAADGVAAYEAWVWTSSN